MTLFGFACLFYNLVNAGRSQPADDADRNCGDNVGGGIVWDNTHTEHAKDRAAQTADAGQPFVCKRRLFNRHSDQVTDNEAIPNSV